MKDQSIQFDFNPPNPLVLLDEESLFQACYERLEASYQNCGDTFHPTHEDLSEIIRECERRQRMDIFNLALRRV